MKNQIIINKNTSESIDDLVQKLVEGSICYDLRCKIEDKVNDERKIKTIYLTFYPNKYDPEIKQGKQIIGIKNRISSNNIILIKEILDDTIEKLPSSTGNVTRNLKRIANRLKVGNNITAWEELFALQIGNWMKTTGHANSEYKVNCIVHFYDNEEIEETLKNRGKTSD